MNRENRIDEIIKQGGVAFGTFAFLPEPAIVEIIGNCGFDFIIFDMEHAPLGILEIERLIRSAELTGMVPFVRIGKDRSEDILRVLEAGAMGVVVPHIVSAHEISRVIETVKYPPVGKRGACRGVRAARYGDTDFAEFTHSANRNTWVIALVEDVEGCENIEEILSVPGLNAVNPGPGDLATILGVPGQTDHPKVVEVVERVIKAGRSKEMPVAMYITELSKAAEWIQKGANMMIYSIDARIIMEAYRDSLRRLRKEVGQSHTSALR